MAFERRRAHVHHLLVHVRRVAALCLYRGGFATVRWIPSEFNTSYAGSRKCDPFYDAGRSVLARLEEKHTRDTKHRMSSGSSQDPFTSQRAPLHPSCRRDTDDAIVVIHDSTMNDAVPFQKKKLCLQEKASHGRVMCLRTKASAENCGTKTNAIPTKQDAKSCGSTCGLQAEIEPHSDVRSSRTQQRHLEYQTTSLHTLANNDWNSHSSSRSSDDEEESGRDLVKSRHRKLQ